MTKMRSRKSALLGFGLLTAGLIYSGPVLADQIPDSILPAAAPVAAQAPAAAPVETAEPEVKPEAVAVEDSYREVGEGEASYYGHELAGNRTASGERFDPKEMTAAHRTLPMGSHLRVTNKANGRSVVVRVNDRGPFAKTRILDVSLAAAQKIDMVRSGKAMVRLELLR